MTTGEGGPLSRPQWKTQFDDWQVFVNEHGVHCAWWPPGRKGSDSLVLRDGSEAGLAARVAVFERVYSDGYDMAAAVAAAEALET